MCKNLFPDDVDLEHDSAFRFLTGETLCILQRYSIGLTVKWRQGAKRKINNTKCKRFGH